MSIREAVLLVGMVFSKRSLAVKEEVAYVQGKDLVQ